MDFPSPGSCHLTKHVLQSLKMQIPSREWPYSEPQLSCGVNIIPAGKIDGRVVLRTGLSQHAGLKSLVKMNT